MDCKLGSSPNLIPSDLFHSSDFSNLRSGTSLSDPYLVKNLLPKSRSVTKDDLEDLLYLDDLTDREVVTLLLRRYLSHKYFTYFGNVLFYLHPLGIDPLQQYSQFLYSDQYSGSHLFPFIREVLNLLMQEPVIETGVSDQKSREYPSILKQKSKLFPERDCKTKNFHVFFYGDDNFGQLEVTQKSLVYLTQLTHSLGLEPTQSFNVKILKVLKLLESLSDYNSRSELCNHMTSYKMNFDRNNHLISLNLVPNFGTDLSCMAVSHSFRDFISTSVTQFFPDFNVRFPSIFYGLLYSVLKEQNKQWLTDKINVDIANNLLEMIPAHENRDPNYHIQNFGKIMEIMNMIGFTKEEVKWVNNVITSVVLLDLYSKLRSSNESSSPSSSVMGDETSSSSKEEEQNPNSDRGKDKESTSSASGASLVEEKNRVLLCKVDLMDLILDVLDTNLLKTPNSELKSSDIFLKMEMYSHKLWEELDNMELALFLRLKYMIYSKINKYLESEEGKEARKALLLHCNAGFNPYSKFLSFSEYHLPWYSSEEFFLNGLFKSGLLGSSPMPESEFISRNKHFVSSATPKEGFLMNLIVESINYRRGSQITTSELTVKHSWKDVTYNFLKSLSAESKMYSLPQMAKKLFKNSKNKVLVSLISNGGLELRHGNCASSMIYYFHLNETIKEADKSYLVVCATPVDMGKSNYTDRFNLVKLEQTEKHLLESFTKKIPLMDICKAQSEVYTKSIPLNEFTKTFFPLLYKFSSFKFHKYLPHLKEEQSVELLFSLLSVPKRMYRTEKGALKMNKPLHVKILTVYNHYVKRHLQPLKVIQTWWKCHQYPLIRRKLVKMLTRVQALTRAEHVRKQIRMAKERILVPYNFIGIVVTCFYINTCLKRTTSKMMQVLHKMEKEFHEKEYEYLQYSAATYIQAIWRGCIERKKYSQVKQKRFEEFSIVLIQSSIRRVLASSEILNMKNTKNIKAIMIQSYFRGYRERKKYQNMMQLKLLLLPILKKGSKIKSMGDQINFIKIYKDHDSLSLQMKRLISVQTNLPPGFVKMQNLVRMRFVRKQYLHLKNCLEKVYALAMTKAARLKYLEKVKAATKIQRWWRCIPKDSFPLINTNPIYYINLKEEMTVKLLQKELKEFEISVFHFTIYQDIRRIYPNTWAMMPLTLLKSIKMMQKSSTDLNYTQIRKIDYVKFAVGSTHSLMLISTNNGSCTYSWGWNDKGQLGRRNLYPMKSSEEDFTQMEPLEFEEDYKDKIYDEVAEKVNIVEIGCGNDFSVALTSTKRAFTWGDNSMGQCGQGIRLVRVHDPRPLELSGVESVCCGSHHTILGVEEEYFVFGKAFEKRIFNPMNIKKFMPHLANQTIEKVNCSGTTTLVVTRELDYVLNVFTELHKFEKMYNLKGNIMSFCTNGKMVCAVVEISRGEYQNADTKIYVFGQVRCIVPQEKNTLGTKSLFVGQFKEKFENIGKKKTKRSALNVYSTTGNTCFLKHPTEVVFGKVATDVYCDQSNLIIKTNTGVYGTKLFQIVSQNPEDFEIFDKSTIEVKQGSSIKLEPSLYQFTNLTKKRPTIYLSSNSLSHSIGYTF